MFRDRNDAGRQLAEELARYARDPDTVVLGIPRGGVIVAGEVASRLGLPLDVVVASKIGAPGNPEFAAGAVGPDGVVLANPSAGLSRLELEHMGLEAKAKIARRSAIYRMGREAVDLKGLRAIIVDDGVATGLTAQAALGFVRRAGASELVLAAPVIARDASISLEREVDALVAVEVPLAFRAVGQFYRHFDQTSDDEVIETLNAG